MDATAFPPPSPAAVTPRLSLATHWEAEAERFKWLESEKAGHDLGESAIRRWVKLHWWGYLRARWLEHLQGKCFWIELDRGDFGLIHRAFQDEKPLLDSIIEQLKSGAENLSIYCWADDNSICRDRVRPILMALDINGHRLVNRLDDTCRDRQ